METDLNFLEYSKHNRGDLGTERLKITEENQKKYKYSDPDKENHLLMKKNKGHYERDEAMGRNIRVIGNPLTNITINRKGRLIPVTVPDKEMQS